MRLAQENEARHVDNAGPIKQTVGCEENRGTENSLEGSDEPSILFTAFVHSERVEHLRAALESDGLTLLSDSKCRQKNGNYAILAKREAVIRVAGHLQNKMTIASLEEQLSRRRSANRQNLWRLPQTVGGIVGMLKTLTWPPRWRKLSLSDFLERYEEAIPLLRLLIRSWL